MVLPIEDDRAPEEGQQHHHQAGAVKEMADAARMPQQPHVIEDVDPVMRAVLAGAAAQQDQLGRGRVVGVRRGVHDADGEPPQGE